MNSVESCLEYRLFFFFFIKSKKSIHQVSSVFWRIWKLLTYNTTWSIYNGRNIFRHKCHSLSKRACYWTLNKNKSKSVPKSWVLHHVNTTCTHTFLKALQKKCQENNLPPFYFFPPFFFPLSFQLSLSLQLPFQFKLFFPFLLLTFPLSSFLFFSFFLSLTFCLSLLLFQQDLTTFFQLHISSLIVCFSFVLKRH